MKIVRDGDGDAGGDALTGNLERINRPTAHPARVGKAASAKSVSLARAKAARVMVKDSPVTDSGDPTGVGMVRSGIALHQTESANHANHPMTVPC